MKKQLPILCFALSLFSFSAVYSQVKDSSQTAVQPMQTQTQTVGTTSTTQATASAATGDVVYRVQLLVVGDKGHLNQFLKRYKITEQPSCEPADDTPARVMIGNYTDYKSAKSRCDELIKKGLKDAFVAPYYNGKRVTIAEAASHTAAH
jgi:hypothetical protein